MKLSGADLGFWQVCGTAENSKVLGPSIGARELSGGCRRLLFSSRLPPESKDVALGKFLKF